MLTKEQRDEILRLVVAHTEHAHRWATQNPQHEIAAMTDLVAYLDSITVPEGWQVVPVEPTLEMIEAGAQRLVSWEDGCVWPDSWSPLQVSAARNEADRVWRSMWLASPMPGGRNE